MNELDKVVEAYGKQIPTAKKAVEELEKGFLEGRGDEVATNYAGTSATPALKAACECGELLVYDGLEEVNTNFYVEKFHCSDCLSARDIFYKDVSGKMSIARPSHD